MAFPNHFLRRAVLLCAVLLLLRPPVRAVPSAGEEAAHTYAPPAHTVVGYYAGWSSTRTPAPWSWMTPNRTERISPPSGRCGKSILT